MIKQQDPLRSIYNDLGLEQAGIAYDKFSTKFMADSNARRSVYNDLGLEQAGIDYDLFEDKLGVKKKERSQSDSQSGLETSGQRSVRSPEFEASNAAYAAEADNRLAAQGQRRQEEDRQNNFPINPRLEGPSEFSGGVGDIFKPLKFGETPDWEGAQSRKLATQIAAWQAANPDMEYAPVRLFEEINQGEIKQAVPSGWGKNMVRRGAHIYNGLLHGIGSLANYAVDTGLSWQAYTNPIAGGVVGDLALTNYRANIAPNVRNALVDVIGVDMSDAERDRWNSEVVTGGLAGLAGTVPALVGSKLRMARMFMLGADAALNSIEEADTEGKISNLSKTVYSVGVGSAVAALEKAGFDRIFKSAPSSLATYVAQKTISDAAKSGGGKVTGDALVRFLNTNLAEVSNRYVRGGVGAVEGMITEFATGASQEIATIGSEGMFNLLSREDIFDTYEDSWDGLMNYIGRVGEAGIMEAVGGGALGGISNIVSASSRKKIYKKIQEVESLRRDLDNPNLSDAEADAVLKTLLDAAFDLQNDLKMSLGEFNSLVEDAKQKIQEKNEQILSAQDVIDSPNTSDEAKEAAEERIAEIGAEIEEIASDPQNKVDPEVTLPSVQEESPGAQPIVSDLMGSEVEMDGKRGELVLDGQTVVLRESPNSEGIIRETEVGNIEDLSGMNASEFGITPVVPEVSDVSVSDSGNITVRGNEYVNNYSDPLTAINRDSDGNIVSVNLETQDGRRRTFRGQTAEDVAYQIHLQEANKNNETAQRFEEFINSPEVSSEIENAGLPEVTSETETGTVETVQPAGVDSAEGTAETPVSQERGTEAAGQRTSLRERRSEIVKKDDYISLNEGQPVTVIDAPGAESSKATVVSVATDGEATVVTLDDGRVIRSDQDLGRGTGIFVTTQETSTVASESATQPGSISDGEQTLSPSFLEDMRTDEGRAKRKEQALADFRAALRGNANVGINGEALAKAVEYAAISLMDGSIKTARALQTALGLNEADAKKVFDQAKGIQSQWDETKLSQNNAPDTQDFFTAVVEGTDPRFIPIKPYETEGTYSPEQTKVAEAMEPKFGNFDTHIATSIPQYRETQVKKTAGIIAVLEGREDARVFDIGGSEGNTVKTISELTGVETYNLEPNEAMASSHEATPVEGSTVIREAFYEGFDGHEAHVPTEKYDVVNESMVFQFITPERKQFIDHVADNYLKEDGLFISEEKLKTNRDLYIENEAQKDSEHKSKYYTPEQLKLKSDQVLMGMDENQADVRDYVESLKDRFDHVGIYWNSGNFYGVAASNSKQTFDTFMASVGDTQTQYTKVTLGEVTDPSTIPSSQIANSEQTLSPSFLEDMRTDEGRARRKEQALKDFKKSLGTSTNMGISGNALAKAMEYAVVSILDGSVKSAKALSKALGVTVEQAQTIYDRAVELTASYRESVVNPPKRSTQAQVRESTRGGVQGRVTQTERQALAGQVRSFARGVNDGQRQASEASKVLNDVMAEMRSRGMLDNLTPTQVQALTKAINSATTPAKVQAAVDRMVEILNPKQPVGRRIRQATEGGIKGKVDLTNKQALREQIKTLNRGIRDGKAQIIEARKAITDFINDMKDQGLFKGKVRGNIIKPLLDKVNRANTPAALSEALAYAEKSSEIIDYDQKRAKAEKNKKEVKRKSKTRGMPQDLKAVMIDISNINLTYVDNIEQFNDMTDRLLDAVKGMDIDGIWTEDFVKLKKSVDEKIEKAREKRLRDELVNAGMDQDFVDGLNTLNQLMEALATLPKESKARSSESLRSIRERALKQTLPMIEEMDRTGFTDKQNAVIDALLGLDVSKISDGRLPSIVIAAKNIAVNGSFLGTGPIEVEHKFHQRTGNTKDAATIKKTVASPRQWLAKIRDKLGSVTTQIDSVLKNRDVVGTFMRVTGFGDYVAKYNVFVDRYNTEVRDKIERVQEKYRKDLQNISQRMLLGAYADLNNSKKSWDDSKRAEEFEGRKEAIKKSYKQMIEHAKLTPRGWGRDNENYTELYKKLVDQLDSFNSVEDIWNSLNRGHQELYKVAREFYDRILPETKQNAEIDNNTIFDTEYQGTYFPRSYMPLDTKVRRQEEINGKQTSILDQMAEGNTFNTTSTSDKGAEVSGAKRARTLTGSQLSPNTYIDLDFMANFLRESKKMLYDVETQAERRYVARVMNSTELLEIFGDADALEIFRNAMIQKMEKDLISTTSRGMKSAIRNISDEIYGLNVNLALGGAAQAIKQGVPQLVDTGFRLGKNQGLLYIGVYMYANGGTFGHLMEGSSVRFRNVRNVEVRDNLLSQKEASRIKRFVDSRLGKLGKKGKEIRDLITMGPLTLGDDFAAKSSWYAHYLDYLERNNLLKYTPDGMMDLAEVNTDARAYADFQVNLSNNESDPAMKAKLFSGTTGSVVRAVFPFISFPLNSKMELIRNLERVVDGDAHTTEQKKAIGRNIGANIANILVYGAIGEIIRDQMVKISGAVISDLVARFGDLDEEDEEKLLAILEEDTNELREANKRNSQEYLIKDLLFGGIAQQFTDPFYDLGSKLYYSAKGDEEALEELSNRGKSSDPWDLAFDAMGGYGIFARTGRRFYTSFSEWHLTDAEWRTRKFGIEDEMGEALVVPFDKEGEKRPLFSRYAYGLSTIAHGMALFTGTSWQEVSGTVLRVQRLAKKAEQELHGRDAGKLKEIKSLKTVTIGDEKVELTEEQFERTKKIRTAVVRRMTLAEVNPVLTTLKEEYGLELPEITRDELGLAAGERVAIEEIRKLATDFAKVAIIFEDNLLEGLEEKERAKVEKELRRHNEAVEAYIEALNLGRTTPEEYEKRKVKK